MKNQADLQGLKILTFFYRLKSEGALTWSLFVTLVSGQVVVQQSYKQWSKEHFSGDGNIWPQGQI